MGSIGGAEILIIFFILIGIPIVVVAAVAVFSRRRRGSENGKSSANTLSTSELHDLIAAKVSEGVRPFEAALSEMNQRLSALEDAQSHERRLIDQGETQFGEASRLGGQERETRLKAR